MNYTTDRWSLCLAWAVVACAACCPAMAGPVSPEYVEQQRAVVNAALAQEKPAEEVTYDLIEMLLSEDLFVPRFAAEALKERELSERQMIHLSNIVWMVPFGRDEGCIRILQWTGSDVCSKYAWDVLAHHTLRDLPAEAQVQWLIGQMRTVGASPQRVAWAASSRASKLGAVAVPALIRALEREGTLAQQAAGGALMDIGTTEAQTAVAGWSIHTLEAYDNPLLWQQAALWLGRLGSAAAFEPLERVLWAHLESTHIWAVIDALVTIDAKRTVAPLVRVVGEHQPDDDHVELVTAYLRAATALARMGDERGWDALEVSAASPVAELRRKAPFAAFATHDERAREILTGLTGDEDEQVVSQAEYWLTELNRTLERMKQGEQ